MTKKSTKAPAKKTAAKAEPAPQVEATEAAAPTTGGKIAKTQLVELVAQKSGLTKKQARQAVDAAMEAMVESIRQGQSVGLPGLGTLSVKQTAARTSERILIPAGKKVAFEVAQPLKGEL